MSDTKPKWFMQLQTRNKLIKFMIDNNLQYFQIGSATYIRDLDDKTYSCLTVLQRNKLYTISCSAPGDDSSTVESYIESYAKQNGIKTQDEISFDQFVGDCFVKDTTDHKMNNATVREIFGEWRKHNARTCTIKIQQVYEMLKDWCGNGSTEKEFIGIRQADPAGMLSLLP